MKRSIRIAQLVEKFAESVKKNVTAWQLKKIIFKSIINLNKFKN